MALAVGVINRRGPIVMKCVASYSQGRLVVFIIEKYVCLPFINNKMKHFSFKSGCVVRVENGKMCHQL